jgi:hypothetical protein
MLYWQVAPIVVTQIHGTAVYLAMATFTGAVTEITILWPDEE